MSFNQLFWSKFTAGIYVHRNKIDYNKSDFHKKGFCFTPKCSNLIENGWNWSELVEIDEDWSKSIENLTELVVFDRFWQFL